MKKLVCLVAALFLLPAALVFGQLKTPQPSPTVTVTQELGISKVVLSYSRPGKKGREIFGELVPYGRMWRTGANASTTLEFFDPVKVGGKEVPAGKYALFTIPGKENWTIILSKSLGWGAGNYNQADDAARFAVKSEQLPVNYENFTIDFANFSSNSADLQLMWDDVRVSFPVEMDVDQQVIAQIDRVMQNPESSLAGTYYSAAQYYFDTERDTEKALEWVEKSLEYNPNAYWVIRLKSRLQARQKNYKAAIETATLSMKKAEEAGNPDYIKLNSNAIAEWKKMQ